MARIGARRRSRGMRPLPSVAATTGDSAFTVSVTSTSTIANRRAVAPSQCRDPQLRHAAAHARRGDRRLAQERRPGARTSARPSQLIPARPCEEHL
jgi:hypothetical protein